jgi:probable phosphoglycerate mutase
MVKFLMIRHGQSEANFTGCFAGHIDSPATELGVKQAQLSAAYIAENYKVDAVYSSDLKRAAVVGEIVAAATGLMMRPDPKLREINAGVWQGVAFDTLVEKFPAYEVWCKDIGNAKCDGGESVAELQQRVVGRLKEIAQQHDGETVVIATHATPIRVTQCYAEGRPLSEMKDIPWVSNSSLTEIDYDGQFHIVRIGYDGYLGDAVSVFPPNV